MNDAQHAALTTYARHLGNLLLLQDWEIEVSRTWADLGAHAQVIPWYRENKLVMRVSEGWASYSPEQQRENLAHELTHAHLARMDRNIERLVEQLDSNEAAKLAHTAHNEELEIVTQRFARIIAPYLPLPPVIQEQAA